LKINDLCKYYWETITTHSQLRHRFCRHFRPRITIFATRIKFYCSRYHELLSLPHIIPQNIHFTTRDTTNTSFTIRDTIFTTRHAVLH
jgi:hypothetical protein